MPTPSLLIVPARFKSGKLYSQIPTSGAGDFTVTRATTATRVNASGLIESVASGIPRLDYFSSDGTVGCPALLVEPSAQNLALQSENFGTTWSLLALLPFGSGSVLNTTATLDPYGTNVADLIVANTTVTQHRVDQTTTSVSGSYVFSVFLKAEGYGFARLRIGGQGATFNLSTGVVITTDSVITSSIQSFGNGWYRCIIGKAASAANEIIRINMQPTASTADFAGDGTSGIYVFGAQYETGSVATSYIPTTTGSVTRNADVVSVSGAVSGSIGQLSGTIYAEVDVRLLGTQRSFIAATLNSNTTDFINFQINTSNQFFTRMRNKTGSLVDVVASGVTTTAGIHKLACSYSSGNITFALDGVIIGTNTNANTDFNAALNCVLLGSGPGAATGGTQSNFLNDRILDGALYTTRLSNAELAALTSL